MTRPGVDRLYDFQGILAVVPLSRRVLRQVIAELGFKPPPGRKKLLLSPEQVEQIKEAVKCRADGQKSPCTNQGENATATGSPESGSETNERTSPSETGSEARPRRGRKHDPLLQSILERRRNGLPSNVVRLPDP